MLDVDYNMMGGVKEEDDKVDSETDGVDLGPKY